MSKAYGIGSLIFGISVLRAPPRGCSAYFFCSLTLPRCPSPAPERERRRMRMGCSKEAMTQRDPVRTGSDACMDAYYEHILGYGRDGVVILRAATHNHSCTLANAFTVHFVMTKKPQEASSMLHDVNAPLGQLHAVRKSHGCTISCLVGGKKDEHLVLNQHIELLKKFPKDLLSLKRAQILCFHLGLPVVSLNIVQQVPAPNEGHSYIYGMLSFPLLELERMTKAEEVARKGLSINRSDFWSQHNLCHVLQNECHFREATSFMEAYSFSWDSCSSFIYAHNWCLVVCCCLLFGRVAA